MDIAREKFAVITCHWALILCQSRKGYSATWKPPLCGHYAQRCSLPTALTLVRTTSIRTERNRMRHQGKNTCLRTNGTNFDAPERATWSRMRESLFVKSTIHLPCVLDSELRRLPAVQYFTNILVSCYYSHSAFHIDTFSPWQKSKPLKRVFLSQ